MNALKYFHAYGICILTLFNMHLLLAQDNFAVSQHNVNMLGNVPSDNYVIKSNDNGFLTSAKSRTVYSLLSNINGSTPVSHSYASFFKTNDIGEQLWSYQLQIDSAPLATYQRTTDNAYVIACKAYTDASNCTVIPEVIDSSIVPLHNFGLFTLSSEGDSLQYSGPLFDVCAQEHIIDAQVYNNDGFLVLSYIATTNSHALSYYNQNAILQWKHTYELPHSFNRLFVLPDNTFIITPKYDNTVTDENMKLHWLHLQADGSIINNVNIDAETNHAQVRKLITLDDNTLLIVSNNGAYNSRLTKITLEGIVIWQQIFDQTLSDVVLLSNNKYLMASRHHLYIFADNGDILWTRAYNLHFFSNGLLADENGSFVVTAIHIQSCFCGLGSPNNILYLVKSAAFQTIKTKALLGGMLSDSIAANMSLGLRTDLLIPLEQPFNQAPWHVEHEEAFSTAIPIGMSWEYPSPVANIAQPDNLVDWVLLEARDAVDNTMVIEQRLGALLSDGNIVDVYDQDNGVYFYNLQEGTAYYFIIRHRNHLDVMSSMPISIPQNDTYDFTQTSLVMDGENQLMNTDTPNTYALIPGDINGDGVITVNDFNSYIDELSTISSYANSDLDGNGSTTVSDYNHMILNISKIGVAAIRY